MRASVKLMSNNRVRFLVPEEVVQQLLHGLHEQLELHGGLALEQALHGGISCGKTV